MKKFNIPSQYKSSIIAEIKEKRKEGFYYLQISDMMNESHFKPQRTLKFTPQQVWGLEFKLEKRLKRLDKIENPRVVSIGLINEV